MCCLRVTESRRPRRCLLTPGEGELTPSCGRESLFLESSIRGASLITDTQLVLILPSRDPGRFIPAGKMAGKEPGGLPPLPTVGTGLMGKYIT